MEAQSKSDMFPVPDGQIKIVISDDVFRPTSTSIELLKASNPMSGLSVLDLGCGTGIAAIFAAKEGAKRVLAVDVMPQACQLAQENARLNGVDGMVEVRCGDLYAPVRGERFDLIICDVSGIAEDIARASPWYPNPVPSGGFRGSELTVRVLLNTPNHLNRSGAIVFPVTSLACSPEITDCATQVFGDNVRKIAERLFPFPKELIRNSSVVEAAVRDGRARYHEKRSRRLWKLEVFKAEYPSQ